LVSADLLNDESIRKAIEGSTYVVHTASPFPSKAPKNEDELIKPAKEGTLSVVKAAADFKVKRVVVTSSVAAITMNKNQKTRTEPYTEEDWSELAACSAYDKSKTIAEQTAWDYQKANPSFELVVINPCYI